MSKRIQITSTVSNIFAKRLRLRETLVVNGMGDIEEFDRDLSVSYFC